MENYKIIEDESDELNKWLFQHHSHAEIQHVINPEGIVYREKDVIELIKLLRENKL